jgi:glycosyltransferase involved in cell wall biosynthesis
LTVDVLDSPREQLAAAPPPRILCFLPSVVLGGMERAVIAVMRQMMRRGAEVHFILDREWAVEIQEIVELAGATWSGVGLVPRVGLPRAWWEVRAQVRALFLASSELRAISDRFQPTVVFATAFSFAFFSRTIGRPEDVVSVFRLPNPPRRPAMPLRSWAMRQLWKLVCRDYDWMVCNSEFTAAQLVETLGRSDRVKVIRNLPPDVRQVEPSDAPVLEPERTRIVYLGRISAAKGVEHLYEAARIVLPLHPEVDFILAGPDPWEDPFAPMIKARCAEDGLEQRFRFVGELRDVQGLLRQAHLHVCPSVSPDDSFPNAILDAKLAGAPSVVFPVAGLPEAVEHGRDGLVTSEPTAQALAHALLQLLEDPALLRRMGAAAKESLVRFDPERIADEWMSLWRDPR